VGLLDEQFLHRKVVVKLLHQKENGEIQIKREKSHEAH
jgi:hypothetical protein